MTRTEQYESIMAGLADMHGILDHLSDTMYNVPPELANKFLVIYIHIVRLENELKRIEK